MVEVYWSRVPAVVDVAAACLAAEQLQKRHQIGIVHLCQDLHLRLGPTVDKEKQEKKRLRNHPFPHLLIPPGKKNLAIKRRLILIFCFPLSTSVHLLPLFPSASADPDLALYTIKPDQTIIGLEINWSTLPQLM